ncbi:MAG: hypothetical protein E7640_00290 [Ruminococcaceae bacterium]|nr:hypothetical protein [Oscillospiraceae bacterium]
MNVKDFFGKMSPTARWLLIAAVLALGLGLLLFSGGGERSAGGSSELSEIEKYERELEGRIKELCSSVRGVSNVTVAVTLEGGFEYVYATDEKGKPVTVGSGSSASAVILRRETPKIAGVGIVCTGGGDENIKNRLISLVSAAYGVGSNRIFITEGKK